MAEEVVDVKPDAVNAALGDMKLEEDATAKAASPESFTSPAIDSKPATNGHGTPGSLSPVKMESISPKSDGEEDTISASVLVEEEAGKPPKLSRKSSQKVVTRPPPLFDHLEDSTLEATSGFQVIRDCIYGSKSMGASEHDALGCDCNESWSDGVNIACGEDSDCINRLTKIECLDDECNCGPSCQNQRFQRKQFANVSVIKTEKKGYGLRADADLQPNDFIFEYIGEVINEPAFRRRMIQYDEEGIKHFYFMSLSKSEFVDATKKGNLGRFCNHSCNPNCYVDKWVVGDKLRMGIFAERFIKAGEELVFNYNVDRYGADPQPCYCNEPNCMGFIGGKTQTERATKLSHTTLEALGIEDGDGWDTTVAKKPRKKKAGEDDEEYVSSLQAKHLAEEGVTKVMATLMQCKEKWIVVKLLGRIQRSDDDRVRNRVIRMHGYVTLRTILTNFMEDNNVVLQVLDILSKFPRLTRNKISDSNIEPVVEQLRTSEHLDIAEEAAKLLEDWSKLEVAYRIPRKKFDPTTASANQFDERRDAVKEEIRKSPSPTQAAPSGPRGSVPQRKFFGTPRPAAQRPLPQGWFSAKDSTGRRYYYNINGQTTWDRPFQPVLEPQMPKAPPKSVAHQKALQDIIDNITKQEPTPKSVTPPVETPVVKKEKKSSGAKWRSLPEEKQMKVYENTLFPHVKYVMDKYKHKIPRDDLKKFAKEISKKIVSSDYKNKRVDDPTKISSKHEKNVKKYVKEYFDKAVAKKAAHDEKRSRRKEAELASASKGDASATPADLDVADANEMDTPLDREDSEPDLSGDEDDTNEPKSPSDPNTPSDEGLKRKLADLEDLTPSDTPNKRTKDSESVESSPAPPPPPPPPPPADNMAMDIDTAEQEELRKQEEELMRENEEALMRENEEALRSEELRQQENARIESGTGTVVNGEHLGTVNGTSTGPGVEVDKADVSSAVTAEDPHLQHERKQVLSH